MHITVLKNEKEKKETETVPVPDDLRREDVEVTSLNSHVRLFLLLLRALLSVYVCVESLERER